MSTQIILSLDYELFFGRQVGTVENCLIRPVDALLEATRHKNIKLVLFVDAGYLVRLKQEASKHPVLLADYQRVHDHLKQLHALGHDIQLHIHPHWEDSYFSDAGWVVDTSRYKLHDFSAQEISNIVAKYKRALTDIVGDNVFAFRAGGWCIQPFEKISEALHYHGIWLDSTVYYQGLSKDAQRWFDFTQAPNKSRWFFEDNPSTEAFDGNFLEIPISSCRISPLFYWKMAVLKKLGGDGHKSFGDGAPMSYGGGYYLERLTQYTSSVASIDGAKAGFLLKAYQQNQAVGGTIFNVIGHPKALSAYSIAQFCKFLNTVPDVESVTFQNFKHLGKANI